jgi:two-component sensor histidine kinase
MTNVSTNAETHDAANVRTVELFNQQRQQVYRRTDQMFAALMAMQWVATVAASLLVSPRMWTGADSHTVLNVLAAVFLGGVISGFPIFLAVTRAGHPATRYVMALAQMLMGALLIHLTGGRIETHFHVLGSLALLSLYRDWRVLIPATIVVAIDHFFRGLFWPQSVYGVMVTSEWRWLEHAGWLLFENTFLLIAINHSVFEMRRIAEQKSEIEKLQQGLEVRLANSNQQLLETNRRLEREAGDHERTRASLARMQNQVKISLEENELLLKRIHHRIEGNLQVITNLLSLLPNTVARINAVEYLDKLIAHVSSTYRSNDAIRIRLNVDDVTLPIDTAISCGLIINELAANSLKYAFPRYGKGEVHITFAKAAGQYILCVSDNGVGLPKDFDPEKGNSLGMNLVRMLTAQLSGELTCHRSAGTSFEITFPEAIQKAECNELPAPLESPQLLATRF